VKDLDAHRDVCPLFPVVCHFDGCKAEVPRRDFDQHQIDFAIRHAEQERARLTSMEQKMTTVMRRLDALESKESQINVLWTITNVPALIARNAKYDSKTFFSYEPEFGKVTMKLTVEFKGNKLGLFLCCDWENAANRVRNTGGTTLELLSPTSTSNAGRAHRSETFAANDTCTKGSGFGWPDLAKDVTPFMKDDSLRVRAIIKINRLPLKIESA